MAGRVTTRLFDPEQRVQIQQELGLLNEGSPSRPDEKQEQDSSAAPEKQEDAATSTSQQPPHRNGSTAAVATATSAVGAVAATTSAAAGAARPPRQQGRTTTTQRSNRTAMLAPRRHRRTSSQNNNSHSNNQLSREEQKPLSDDRKRAAVVAPPVTTTPPPSKPQVARQQRPTQTTAPPPATGGCHVCGLDNDHARMLLCERCNGEYHIYCLSPKLDQVPLGDWFCGNCNPNFLAAEESNSDGLHQRVCALPPKFSSRFGEICWAQGGVGYGWWPSCIYDPRLTVGSARQQAKRQLGKKHLVYFFQCNETPFAVIGDNKLTSWDEGMALDFHLGRSAKNVGKLRYRQFQQALHTATVEESKPVAERLDWNHSRKAAEPPKFLPSPTAKRRIAAASHQTNMASIGVNESPSLLEQRQPSDAQEPAKKRPRGRPPGSGKRGRGRPAGSGKTTQTATFVWNKASTKYDEDGSMVCRIVLGKENLELGFVIMKSRATCTFASVREEMIREGLIMPEQKLQFRIPNLGPVSHAQETSLGPLFSFLADCTAQAEMGDGSSRNPIKLSMTEEVLLQDYSPPQVTLSAAAIGETNTAPTI